MFTSRSDTIQYDTIRYTPISSWDWCDTIFEKRKNIDKKGLLESSISFCKQCILNVFISYIHPSIHLSIFCLSGVGMQGQHSKERSPDFLLSNYVIQLFPRFYQASRETQSLQRVPCLPGTRCAGGILKASKLDARATSSGSPQRGGAAAQLSAPPGWQSFSPCL